MYLNKFMLLKIAIFISYGMFISIVFSGILMAVGGNFRDSMEMFIYLFVEIVIMVFLIPLFKRFNEFKNSKLQDLVPNKENVNTFLFGILLSIANVIAYMLIFILLAGKIQSLWIGSMS